MAVCQTVSGRCCRTALYRETMRHYASFPRAVIVAVLCKPKKGRFPAPFSLFFCILQIEECIAAQILCHFARRRHTSRSRRICRSKFLVRFTVPPLPHRNRFAGFRRGPRAGLSKASAFPQCSYRLKKASRPRYCATSPSSSSMRSSWLYFATRSVREGAPVLI